MIDARFKGPLPLARRRSTRCSARLALRHAARPRLRAPVHRRRDRRGSDRRRPPIARPRACTLTLDYLGESVAHAATRPTPRRATTSTSSTRSSTAGIERNISLKLTQLGLDVDRATASTTCAGFSTPADAHGFFVRIDMENSPYTDVTLDIFETLWQQGYRNIGVVLQSALQRSEQDLRADERARRARPAGQGRLQGAARPSRIRTKADVDAAFVADDAACCSTHGTLPGHRHARPGDDRRDATRVQRAARLSRTTASSSRCCTASGATCRRRCVRRRLPRARLRAVRPRVVSLFHAPARRTPRQRRLRAAAASCRTAEELSHSCEHQRRASSTSASRQASTLSISTNSSTPCRPAPVGPNSSEGMPASPSTARRSRSSSRSATAPTLSRSPLAALR